MWKTGSVLIAAIVASAMLASEPARAQSCADLQAELGSLAGGGGGGSGLAAARQRLGSLQRQASANGCNGSSSVGKPRACAGIQSKISTVSGQVAALEAKGGGGGAGNENRRRRIQSQMTRLKCGQAPAKQQQARQPAPAEPTAAAPAAGGGERGNGSPRYVVQNNRMVPTQRTEGGLFSLLFGGQRAGQNPNAPTGPATLTSLQPGPKGIAKGTSDRPEVDADGKVTYARHFFGGGSYRTLCVRSCDGYYFPISTVTSRGNFGRDEAVCQSLCPNSEAALYAHSAGSESENMYRVIDGRSYRELPTAFQYRKTYDPACTCTFAAKMILSADGKEVIDVEGSRAAYSPAVTTDAATAIDGVISPLDGAVEPAVVEAGVSAGVMPAAIDASATGGAVQTDAGGAVASSEIEAMPAAMPAALPATLPAASPGPADPGSATTVTASGQPEAERDSSLSATTAATVSPEPEAATLVPTAPAATAPRGAPVPQDTPEPLRVRTIGPEFLQEESP
jgi:hypothetical protein